MELELGIVAAVTLLGVAIGFLVPHLSNRYIVYREKKYQTHIERTGRPIWEQAAYVLSGAVICGLAGYCLPLSQALLVCVFAVLLLTVTDIDNRCRLIPNPFVLALLGLGVVYRITLQGLAALPGMGIAVIIAIIMLALTSLVMRGKSAVGAGDVKLILVMAITAGMPDFFYGLFVMAICMIAYSCIGVILMKLTRYSFIPMGGCISAGYLASFIAVPVFPYIVRFLF